MAIDPPARSEVERAIVPAAGYGTRMRPLTRAIPKEMLPLGRKPVLEYVVEELRDCGVTEILFVVSPGKESIERYFGDGANWSVACRYVTQPRMKGLGDAILLAEEWCAGKPVLVAFGDCVIETDEPRSPAGRLVDCSRESDADAVVLAQRVGRERVSRYGILALAAPGQGNLPMRLLGIVEKPRPEDAPSDLAVAGRWVIGQKVFDLLKRTPYTDNGELSLTDAISLGLNEGLSAWAVPLGQNEARLDIGSWETYLAAAARYALTDGEFGSAIRTSLGGDRP